MLADDTIADWIDQLCEAERAMPNLDFDSLVGFLEQASTQMLVQVYLTDEED